MRRITLERSGERITLEEYNRELLRTLYTTFKAADEYLQFVMLTGVTKFSQVSVFSGFNQPNDISMDARYDTLCGITEEEIDHYFQEPVAEMARMDGCTEEEEREALRRRFNGYHFSNRLRGVYNPFSLLNSLQKLDIQDYWFRTGTPTYLVRLLGHFNENINELTGKYYAANQFMDYRADVEKPLPMIFQSGYLTIKNYDRDTNTFLIDFPNDEVKRGFITLLTSSYLNAKDNVESWMATAVVALKQIEEKGYAREFACDQRQIHKIGCSFSSASGTIEEWQVE